MKADGEDQSVNLLRCAWAGSRVRRTGLVRDIHSFRSLRNQLLLPDSIWESRGYRADDGYRRFPHMAARPEIP